MQSVKEGPQPSVQGPLKSRSEVVLLPCTVHKTFSYVAHELVAVMSAYLLDLPSKGPQPITASHFHTLAISLSMQCVYCFTASVSRSSDSLLRVRQPKQPCVRLKHMCWHLTWCSIDCRTNLFRRHAGRLPSNTYRPLSAQGECSPGHDDSFLTAGLSSLASGAQTGQGGCSQSHHSACSAGVVRSPSYGGQTGQLEMKQTDCAPGHSRHDDASLMAALNGLPSGAQTDQHTVMKADRTTRSECHEDAFLSAAYSSPSSGKQTRQHVVTREEAYKPGSPHLTYKEETQPNMQPESLSNGTSKASQMHSVHTEGPQPKAQFDRTSKVSLLKPPGSSSAAENVISTGNAAADAQRDFMPAAVHGKQKSSDENDAESVHEALKSGEQNAGRISEQGTARRPMYMRSTASVKAKADVAERQIRACMRKAAQQAKRRWSY